MLIRQIYTGCLSEAAYFIESNGHAAVIDPLRDVEGYIRLAKEQNATIDYIFETHFHADFVSGHLDLQKKTKAPIVYGPNTVTNFPIHLAKDGEIFQLGNITIEVLHTPGHTLESTCYLLRNEEGKAYCVFTGDTLFVGDVGRPDLSSGNMSKEELAEIMYHSLQTKILPLNDDIIVYPAHGPGSSCGKNIGPDTSSTIGDEKKTNYALKPRTKEDFVKVVTEGLGDPPSYFQVNAKINKEGYDSLEEVKRKGMTPLTVEDFKEKLKEDVVLVDTRPAAIFSQGYIPGSIFIGLEGRFAEWAGSILSFEQRMILVTEEGKEEETIVRLARVGFDKVEGFLEGGFEAWRKSGEPIDMLIEVEADELGMDLQHDDKVEVIDVRKENEFAEGHVKDAINLPLSDLTDIVQVANIDPNKNLYIHCAGGYRSTIACSLLKRQGYHNIRNIQGGWNRIKDEKRIKTEKEASVLN